MRGRVMRLRGTSALALSVALVLSGCTGGGEEVPAPPIGVPSSPDSSASASEDPWAIPDPITEDYLVRVLNELEREIAQFDEWVTLSEPGEEPPDSILKHVRSVLVPELVDGYVELFLDARDGGAEFASTVRPRGQYRVMDIETLRVDPDCPLLRVEWDSSAVVTPEGNQRDPQVIGLELVRGLTNNPTGWHYELVAAASDVTQADIDEQLEGRSLCED